MPVQRFAPMTKDYATFDCDAHITEPPVIWERAADHLTKDELEALKATIWFEPETQQLIVNGKTNAGAGTPDSSPGPYWDKVPVKWAGWTDSRFEAAGFRAVPGAVARHGSFIGRDVVLMPSFVNIGARVEEGTMVDTWATVGSCAQIGRNVHLSGGAGIGGVLEPLQANPTSIEDGCFIGARAEVAEGVIVREGAVLAMGVYLSASTRIVDRATGEVFRGEVPAYAVVVPGTLPDPKGGPGLYCAVIVKRVDAQTRAKTGVNELLRA
mgnify:CR=1 FL=1